MNRRINKRNSKARRLDFEVKPVEDKYFLVKKAAENPNYKFRTFSGVMNEARVSASEVDEVVNSHPNEFVILHRRGASGQKLITTREHYNKNANLKEKLLGVVLNRVY